MNIEANAGDGEKVALGRVVIAVLGNGWPNGQTKSATVNDIILSIREGKYDPNLGKRLDGKQDLDERVTMARSLRSAGSKKEYVEYKKSMPCVCWGVSEFGPDENGRFGTARGNIKKFSGFVFFDIDGMPYVDAKAAVIKSGLNPYVFRMWKSLSGNGLGGLVWAPWIKSKEDYKRAYDLVGELYGGILDTNCSNADRKNVISWSPNVYTLSETIPLPEPSQKSAVSENKAVEPSQKSAVSENKAVEPSQKSAVSENKAVTSGIDVTDEALLCSSIAKFGSIPRPLADCFGLFLLENKQEPLPRGLKVSSYQSESSSIEPEQDVLVRMRDALRMRGSSYSKYSSYIRIYHYTSTAPFCNEVLEPYLELPEAVPCVKIYLPKRIRVGSRRKVITGFAVNYYWKYPERLSLEHLRSLVDLISSNIEGKLDENTVDDVYSYVAGLAALPGGIRPCNVVYRKVFFAQDTGLDGKTRSGLSSAVGSTMRSDLTREKIMNFILNYSGTVKLTNELIVHNVGLSIRQVKNYTSGLRDDIRRKNEELGLVKPRRSRKETPGESESCESKNVQVTVESSPESSAASEFDE